VIRKPFKDRPKVRLDTLAGIRREMGKVYRYAQRGELDWTTATRAVFILSHIAKLDQGVMLEQRLAAVEQRVAEAERADKARVEQERHGYGRPSNQIWGGLPPQ